MNLKIDHPTTEPPTEEKTTSQKIAVAVEVLRCIEEDWDMVTDEQKKESVETALKALN
jgi:hypothetical protein